MHAFENQSGFTVVAHPLVIDRLLTAEAPAVADLELLYYWCDKVSNENFIYARAILDIILELKL